MNTIINYYCFLHTVDKQIITDWPPTKVYIHTYMHAYVCICKQHIYKQYTYVQHTHICTCKQHIYKEYTYVQHTHTHVQHIPTQYMHGNMAKVAYKQKL